MRDFAVVIPAYQPDEQLIPYVEDLLMEDVPCVVVIDDGSGPFYSDIFEKLKELSGVHVIRYQRNRGKGHALKTGFRYFLDQDLPSAGVVTCDADRQHSVRDVITVGEVLAKQHSAFVLGTRTFHGGDIPFRSKLGNRFTAKVFSLFFGTYINDTQTGLRGIRREELDWVIALQGDQFDFEMNMLIQLAKKEKKTARVDIETIYHDDYSSHYETLSDSVLVAKQLLKGVFVPEKMIDENRKETTREE